jgi:hypothetical protein
MYTKFHTHERCGTLRKSSIFTRGYAENSHTKAVFGEIKLLMTEYWIPNPSSGYML